MESEATVLPEQQDVSFVWPNGELAILVGLLIFTVNSVQVPIVLMVKSIRASTSPYIISLLISDAIYGATIVQNSISEILDVSSTRFLYTAAYMHVTAMFCSNFHTLAISIDRYIAIFHPLRYEGIMTPKVTAVSIVVVWMAGPIFWLFAGHFKADPESDFYITVALVVLFVVISSLIIVIHCKIGVIAFKQSRKINAQAATPQKGISNMTRVLSLILGCYFLFWLPYFTVTVYFTYVFKVRIGALILQRLFGILGWTLLFASLNSLANVFVYSLGTKAYREWFGSKISQMHRHFM
ncbi:hypothetical protein CAPTEDRAFT_197630 [Capitella teleta]|uniref:G-protein coupled receptors family 1 profile domain-containing protein n=1 Tax=Capitella teleta TaxID=283909 RepID=R7U0Z0_CAPTE|nr:hypothetical protein CAPTEDRAFT_197630 [Capitella teleta]|eukprot:ELT99552.1 hypothetical protein CAPTEDRAFT_197630 [Capitella teleta]